MKKQLLQIQKAFIMVILSSELASQSLFSDEIYHLNHLLMIGEISQSDYDFIKEKMEDGIDPKVRLQMVGEDYNYSYLKKM